MNIDPALHLAAPAELGTVSLRHALRRHLAAAMLDLAARQHLHISDAGNDPTLGYALDWYLLLPGEAAPVGVDATNRADISTAHPRHAPWPSPAPRSQGARGEAARSGAAGERDGLRAHERQLLTLVADTPNRLLSRVRAHPDLPHALSTLEDDVAERGWFRNNPRELPAALLRHPSLGRRRTPAGHEVAHHLHEARTDLKSHRPDPDAAADLLPVAVTLGLLNLWTAHLGQLRPPPPSWFTPGPWTTSRGWLGVCNAATAMSAEPPPGGGAGSALL